MGGVMVGGVTARDESMTKIVVACCLHARIAAADRGSRRELQRNRGCSPRVGQLCSRHGTAHSAGLQNELA